MAGLFWVLRGEKSGGFSKAEGLKGTDGELLIIPASEEQIVEKICTRPTAADMDGDGDLDLVVGNFGGTFYLFMGEGKGKFAPKPEPLRLANGERMKVPHHSDPFVIDWDGDGDLDILSGSSEGGVFLFSNIGSKGKASFAASVTLVPTRPGRGPDDELVFGEAQIKGPQRSTRVYADDVNGDGKLDLLIGDGATISTPGEGLDEETARKKHALHQKKIQEAMMGPEGPDQAVFEKFWEEGKKIVKQEMTGFVWIMYGR